MNKLEFAYQTIVKLEEKEAQLSTTIAQLREENERLKGVMKQASGHLTNLQLHIEQLERRHRLFIDTHVDMVMEVMSQALTPKPPKTNG